MYPVLEEESMRKPVEAIERMRKWEHIGGLDSAISDANAILAYLDSIPPDAVPVVEVK